jgi:hypothetical protein
MGLLRVKSKKNNFPILFSRNAEGVRGDENRARLRRCG